MKHTMRKMSHQGDEAVAEWDTDTVSAERLLEIEREFDRKMREGWFAADLRDNTLIDRFNKEAEILLIPKVAGGI